MHRGAALWVCASAGIWIRLRAWVLRGADGWCGDRVWGRGMLLAEVIGSDAVFPRPNHTTDAGEHDRSARRYPWG